MVIIAEKQKKKTLEEILASFLHEIELRKRKDLTFKTYLLKYYSAVVVLPYPFQYNEANKWIAAVRTAGIDPTEFTFNEHEKKAYSYINEISTKKPDFMSEINILKKSVISDKNEIRKILASKSFKIGRRLTKKEIRLSLSRFSRYIDDFKR